MDARDLHLRLDGGAPLADQLYRQLRSAIDRGRLVSGDRLPASRYLAAELGVSRTTVSAAYERLAGDGLITGRGSAGTFVSTALTPPADVTERPASPLRPRAFWDRIAPAGPPSAVPPRYNFLLGLPDATRFPFQSWRRFLIHEVRTQARGSHGYGESAGLEVLRRAIARHIATARGVDADPAQVVVTGGAQQAVDLVARVMLEPGDVVAVEEPGYPPVRLLLESLGARVVPVRVDGDGMVVDELPDESRLVYLCPSHSMPMGVPMSGARRQALLAWSRTRDVAIVEDDYDSEFHHGARPADTLWALDGGGRVFFVGTFSKSLSPAIRIGYVVGPRPLADALAAARFVSDLNPPLHTQGALARFLDEGQFARHLRRMRGEYRARHEELLGALNGQRLLRAQPVAVGLHVVGRAADDLDDLAVSRRLRSADVAVYPLSGFFAGSPTSKGFVLAFGAIARPDIKPGIARLLAALGT